MSVRTIAFSLLRTARKAPPRLTPHSRPSRRTLFGLGSPAQPPTTLDEAELAKTQEWATKKFQDNPEFVEAVLNFAKFMEDEGIAVSGGKMPGPLQLMKLARNPKFVEVLQKTEDACSKAGVDVRSPEMVNAMMKLVLSLPRGP